MTKLSRRYHVDIGFPETLEQPMRGLMLWYSQHAWVEAQTEAVRHGYQLWVPVTLPEGFTLVEATTLAGRITSWVVRLRTESPYDVALVIRPDGMVKTVWTNDRNDTHRTLDRSLYDRPEAS